MMTFLDIAARNERDHAEKLALRDEQVRIMAGHRDEFEGKFDIAMELLVATFHYSKDEAERAVDDAYEARQATRKAAV